MTRCLFNPIDELFWPNNYLDVVIEDPIYIKSMAKGDVKWSTKKIVMRWAIDTVEKFLTQPQIRRENISVTLEYIQLMKDIVSNQK